MNIGLKMTIARFESSHEVFRLLPRGGSLFRLSPKAETNPRAASRAPRPANARSRHII